MKSIAVILLLLAALPLVRLAIRDIAREVVREEEQHERKIAPTVDMSRWFMPCERWDRPNFDRQPPLPLEGTH